MKDATMKDETVYDNNATVNSEVATELQEELLDMSYIQVVCSASALLSIVWFGLHPALPPFVTAPSDSAFELVLRICLQIQCHR
jgi:hypothetical protein